MERVPKQMQEGLMHEILFQSFFFVNPFCQGFLKRIKDSAQQGCLAVRVSPANFCYPTFASFFSHY